MDIVIIEDEDIAAESLERLLLSYPHNIIIKKRLDSVSQSVEWFKNNTCDLILSDIHLGDGESFEIFETLNINTPIIFITAFDEYAIKSFEFYAIDYLLKPYNKAKLQVAIEKYINLNVDKNTYYDKLKSLLVEMNNKGNTSLNEKERFLVTKGEELLSIRRKDIAYFMAQDKYLFLYTRTGESYLYDDTLTNLEQKVPYKYFFKINRKYIIQHSAIKSITKYSHNRIKIDLDPTPDTDEPILVSSKNINDFKDWLNQ